MSLLKRRRLTKEASPQGLSFQGFFQSGLISPYAQVRNPLIEGLDPSEILVDREGSPGDESVSTVAYFRAGLSIMLDAESEEAAFDEFVRRLREVSVQMGHSADALERQDEELKLVRAYLADPVQPWHASWVRIVPPEGARPPSSA